MSDSLERQQLTIAEEITLEICDRLEMSGYDLDDDGLKIIATGVKAAWQASAKINRAAAETQELVDALAKYGRHKASCNRYVAVTLRRDSQCDCGWTECTVKYHGAGGAVEEEQHGGKG